MAERDFSDLTGGLDLTQSRKVDPKSFTVMKNMFYNNAGQIQTRRGFRKFADPIGSSPMTSIFAFKRDDTLERIMIGFAGGTLYKYNESTDQWDSVDTNFMEYETLPGKTDQRTRWDFAVYKNVIYMCDGVNPYCSYDGTTLTRIGLTTVSSGITFDNSTNTIQKTSHGLNDGDEIYFSADTLPAELTLYQVYYVVNQAANTFQISTAPDGDPVSFTDNGSGTHEYNILSKPRCRYVSYLADRVFGAGDDANPSTLYYTAAASADGTTINTNAVVVGGDEGGVINGIDEYNQLVVVFKDNKSYTVDVANSVVDPIDTETGGYCDRSIASIDNSLVYFNDRGIDTLVKRSGIGGSTAIKSKPLSDKVRTLLDNIQPKYYNASAATYIKDYSNYYFTFDTDQSGVPNDMLVYNAMTGGWSQYDYLNVYDFAKWENSSGEKQYLFTSGSGGQVYEMEYGFKDNGADIEYQLTTPHHEFNKPNKVKVFDFVTISGWKQEGDDIDVQILVDEEAIGDAKITNTNINYDIEARSLGTTPLGTQPLNAHEGDGADMPLYKFSIKIPFFERGTRIAIDMQSTSTQWILENYVISVDFEPEMFFIYDDTI